MCETFGTLPTTGGLFGQPSQYVSRMYQVLLAQAAVEKAEMDKTRARAKAHKAASKL